MIICVLHVYHIIKRLCDVSFISLVLLNLMLLFSSCYFSFSLLFYLLLTPDGSRVSIAFIRLCDSVRTIKNQGG